MLFPRPRNARCTVFAGALLLLAIVPLPAQLKWERQQPSASATERTGHSLVYDSLRQRVVLFGGNGFQRPGGRRGDVWEWDGSTWIDRIPATNSPPDSAQQAMAFDVARARTVLFAGGDTWEWDGTSWMKRRPATQPSARHSHAMVYDESRGRVVLFGGTGVGGPFDDTWEWDGSDWTQLTSQRSPSPRFLHGMVYDSARRRVVLFGGQGAGGLLDDTWEWTGTSWKTRRPAQSPSARFGHAMAYDRARQRTVVFSGLLEVSDTWEWDGTTWTQRFPMDRPPEQVWSAMTYDAARGEVLMFGVVEGAIPNQLIPQTWTYRPTVAGAATVFGRACDGVAGAPRIEAVGAPIIGNAAFGMRISNVAAASPTFLVASARLQSQSLGGCTVYPETPFAAVLWGTSSLSGTATFEVPIPLDTALAGTVAMLQAGALDPAGALFGMVSLTPGLFLAVGD